MAWGKEFFFEVFRSTRKYIESIELSVRFSDICLISYEYVMVLRFKGHCRATTRALSVYFGADTQTIILDTICH